jgi:CDP-diacylglycerol--serine O-phosphatidyltransferase
VIKKHIPNALTCANLLSGCIGSVYAFKGDLKLVAFFVIVCGIFDFFDGFAARLLHVKSDIGKELDSLADVISFGLLPGIIFYQLLLQATNLSFWLPYTGFLITVFSAIRLAKFNIDTQQTEFFIGLNTPMNTFFVISLPYLLPNFPILGTPLFLLVLILVLSYLLISDIRLFAFKLTTTAWKPNQFKYIFLILSAISLAFLMFAALPIILRIFTTTF